jgi:branched-chain amino acid aminotransferase
MAYPYFSRDGEVLPAAEAVVPLSDIHYAYGFGVYETVRVAAGKPRQLKAHAERLMESARIIGLDHRFDPAMVARACEALAEKNRADNCNLKILLIGGTDAGGAQLNILCLNPRYPDRKLYKEGAHTIAINLERPFPHAKTLNMLPSYLAHRQARAAGAYDALLVNRRGFITEGTSTNVFAIKDRTIFSPPEAEILLGVTRDNVLKTARWEGFTIEEAELPRDGLDRYDNLFLTGTSIKIMPVRSVDDFTWDEVSPELKQLMSRFDQAAAG